MSNDNKLEKQIKSILKENDDFNKLSIGLEKRLVKAFSAFIRERDKQKPGWVSGRRFLPKDDSDEDYPRQYTVRFKGDDPRTGWIDAEICTAQQMKEIDNDDYWEWYSEYPFSHKPQPPTQ